MFPCETQDSQGICVGVTVCVHTTTYVWLGPFVTPASPSADSTALSYVLQPSLPCARGCSYLNAASDSCGHPFCDQMVLEASGGE